MIFEISKRGGRGAFPLFLFLMTLLAMPLRANGGSDEGYDAQAALEAVDSLIEERRLNEAIEAVTVIVRRDPEQMERGQQRIQEILLLKNRLNDLFQEAQQAATAGDFEGVGEVVDRLKDEFPHLNRADRNRLIILNVASSRQKDLATMRVYFEAANEEWTRGRLLEALQAYLQGMTTQEYSDLVTFEDYLDRAPGRLPTIYDAEDPVRQEQIWDIYSTDVPEAEALTTEIHSAVSLWLSGGREAALVSDETVAAVRVTQPADWPGATDDLLLNLADLEAATNTLRSQADELEDRWATIFRKFDEAPEVFHFERQVYFLSGWDNTEFADEGVFAVQEQIWNDSYLNVADTMGDIMISDLDAGRDAYRSGIWDIAGPNLIRSAAAAVALETYLDRSADYVTARTAAENTRLGTDVAQRRTLGAYAAAAAPYRQELAVLGSLAEELESVDIGADQITFDTLANSVQELVVRAEDLETAWDDEAAGLAFLPASDAPVPVRIDSELREDLSAAIRAYKEQRLNIYVNAIKDLFESRQRLVEEASAIDPETLRLYALGQERGDGVAPERHPSDALATTIEPALEGLRSAGRAVEDFLGVTTSMLEADPPIDNPEEVIRYRNQAVGLQEGLVSLTAAMEQLDREARVFSNAALSAETSAINALERARRDLAAAQAAVQRGTATGDIDQYYRARDLYNVVDDSLDRVDNFYLDMFNNDRDIAEASGLDADRKALRAQVEQERGDIAIIVKENAINRASVLYEQSNYYDGLDLAVEAQEFWKDSYDNREDPVLAFWIDTFTNALLALRDTTIDPSDPLFSEMNQYLNLANRYYEAGVRIRTEDPGNADAPLSFNAASGLLAQVLSVFPGNEPARLLELKILAETSPDVFADRARDVINESRRAIVAGNLAALRGSDTEQGLYARLLVLEQVSPAFPNLERTIADAENLLFPKPEEQFSQAQINESRDLYQRALTIDQNLGADGADQVIALCEQALRIWPLNEEAQALADRARRRTAGVQQREVLAPELEARIKAINDALARQDYGLAIILADSIPVLFPNDLDNISVIEILEKVEPFR